MECKRCGEPSVLESRGEPFCERCFVRFVQYRQKRQMEMFKVNFKDDSERHVLLALSMGPASIALLDMCVETIRHHKETFKGRQGFHLHAVIVDETSTKGETDKDLQKSVDILKDEYPECEFDLIDMNYTGENSEKINIRADVENPENVTDAMKKMTRTSKQDAATALKYQIIHNYGQKFQWTLYGHTQTRLAELVITSTAKGRGSSVPHFVDEYMYPLREVLSGEVNLYNQRRNLHRFVVTYTARIPGTTKLQSIDELVHQYFRSVEEGFPSVVATVVRTASKLAPGEVSKSCAICGGPMDNDTLEWIKKITVHPPTEDQSTLLCYGCVVMFRNSVGAVNWPRYSKQQVLDEYEL